MGNIATIVSNLPMTITWVIAYITNVIATIMAKFLSWVITTGSDFSYTRPGPPNGNPIIKAGFDVTLSFVNMILVMALIFIALTTILRLREYETKKLLTKFIIIALIINFSPVICGLVVDASNIVMNYFLIANGPGNQTLPNTIWYSDNAICGYDANDPTFQNRSPNRISWNYDVKTTWTTLGKVCVDCTFQSVAYVILIFIYLLFALLFLLRMFAIWILVILSPIAFACAILPATQRFWNEWRDNFINWCLVGVTGGFFLWLGGRMAVDAGAISDSVQKNVDVTGGWIFAYIVPIIFLVLGFTYALKTSASGASMVSNFVGGLASGFLGTAIGTAKWTGKQAVGATKWTGRQALDQTWGKAVATERGKGIASSLAQGTWGADKMKQSSNFVVRNTGRLLGLNPLAWATRKTGAAVLRSGAGQEAEISKLEEKYKTQFGKDYKRASATYGSLGLLQYKEKIALARHLASVKGGKGFKSLSKKQQKEALQLTQKYNPGKLDDIAEIAPEWIITDLNKDDKQTRALKRSVRMTIGIKPIASGSGLKAASKKKFAANLGDFVKKIPTESMKNIDEDMVKGDTELSKMFMRSLIEQGRASQVSAMTEGIGGKGGKYIEDALSAQLAETNAERAKSGLAPHADIGKYLQDINPRLYEYFKTGQGKGQINLP